MGLTPEHLQRIINLKKPFDYLHDGILKKGWFSRTEGLMVGMDPNSQKITTVIDQVDDKYINNLRK